MTYERLLKTLCVAASICLIVTLISCDGVLDPLGDPNGDDDTADDDDTTAADDDVDGPVDLDGDGWTEAAGDCDDGDPEVHPDAVEVACDAVDNDCDGQGEGAAVAEVDGLEYGSFADAVSAAVDGSTIRICSGTHTERIKIPDYYEVTITSASGNAEDTILDGEGSHRAIVCGQQTAVSVTDLTIQNGLGAQYVPGDSYSGGGGLVSKGPILTLQRVDFIGNTTSNYIADGGAVHFHPDAFDPRPPSLWIEGCLFDGNSTDTTDPNAVNNGGAIEASTYEQELTFTLIDSVFVGNETNWYGGAVYLDADPLAATIERCSFEGNAAPDYRGGAIEVDAHDNEVTFVIDESDFVQNTSGDDGGAVDIQGGQVALTVTNTVFEANDGDCEGASGGALNVNGWQSVTVSNSTFTDNHTGYIGGAICLDNPPEYTAWASITNSAFEGNSAEYDGGAVGFHQSSGDAHIDVTLDELTFTNNTSLHYGGALSVHNGSALADISLTNSVFEANSALLAGALDVSYGEVDLDIESCSFISNEAEQASSALYTYARDLPYTVTLTDVMLDSNAVTVLPDEGAVAWVYGEITMTLDSCTVVRNTGGGFRLWDEATTILYSVDTDWGTGADDNDPFDVAIWEGASYDSFGAGEYFACDGVTGCI